MPRKRQPEHKTLFFAVLDGDNPRTWQPFAKTFEDLTTAARETAEPFGVPARVLEQYAIDIQPLLVGPQDLLSQDHLNKIVGIIIDAMPKGATPSDYFNKHLDTLRQLCVKMGKVGEQLAKQYGYQVWFVTSDFKSAAVSRFVESVREVLQYRLGAQIDIRYDYIVGEAVLAHQWRAFLSNAYYALESHKGGES